MKRLLLILGFIISINAFGQIHKYGMQGGLNLTNMGPDAYSSDTRKFRYGFLGGINYEYILKDLYSFKTGIMYSQQGFKFELLDIKVKFHYDYLMIPLKFGYVIGNKFKIIPQCGIYSAMILNSKTIINSNMDENGNYLSGDKTINTINDVSKFDFGGLIELESSWIVKDRMEFFTSIGFRQSFTNFSYPDYFGNQTMKHNGFAISIGLKRAINN